MESRYLFRGVRIDNGELAIGSLIVVGQKNKKGENRTYMLLQGCTGSAYTHEVIPETVGQATGLLDKNGMMIFEGDQVKVFIQGAWFETTVFWGIKSHGWSLKCDRTNEKFGTIKYYSLPSSKHIEVIGNIHDKN